MAAIMRPGAGDLSARGSRSSAAGRGRTSLGSAATALVGTPRTASDPLGSASRGITPRLSGGGHASAAFPSLSSAGPASGKLGDRSSFSLKSAVVTPASSSTASMGLVRAIKATGHEAAELSEKANAGTRRPSGGHRDSQSSDGEESDTRSQCSNMSTLSNMSASQRGGGKTKSGHGASSGGNKNVHISFSSEAGATNAECSIDIEQQNNLDKSKMSLCIDFKQLCAEGQGDGLLQCLQMNRYEKPNKLQQHAVPPLLHLMGKELGGSTGSAGTGKSCVVIQGPAKSGKTSAVVLSMLSAIDLTNSQPQAILLSSSPTRDFDKLLSVFTLMQSIRYQSFLEEDENPAKEIDERAPEVRAARTAHLLVGHPRHILRLLSAVPNICLDSVKALVIDDVEELLYQLPKDKESQSEAQVVAAAAKAGIDGLSSGDSLAIGSSKSGGRSVTPPLVDTVVQICNVLEARQYSQNMSDTYNIRSGQTQGTKIRYVILSQPLTDAASRKILRLLKNSLMKKKNLLGLDSLPPPTRIIKAMKHYYAVTPQADFVRVFNGLVQSLMFPRAVIFCDNENFETYAREMQEMGIAVSVNLPDSASGASDARRRAVQDFSTNKTQFLLTRAEPAICQIALPKVSSVFHFGLPPQLPSVYGVRLLPLESDHVKDAPSILFVDAPRTSSTAPPQMVRSVGKLFDVEFLEMPFEFLPSQSGAGGRRPRR